MKLGFVIVAAFLSACTTVGGVVTRTVSYMHNTVEMEGFVAFDDAVKGPRPGVLIVHQWMGPGAYERSRAEQLAKLGYVAFVVDVYGRWVRPKDAQEAGAEAGRFKANRSLLRARVLAGLTELKKFKELDPKRVGAIGYCFGGTSVLELARSGAEVAGVVSFHGGLGSPTPGDARQIKGRVLALHGADDPFVPAAEVAGFESEMRAAGVDWQLISYGGAVHSFTMPSAGTDNSKGAAYNAKADARSWEHMKTFFAEIFR